MAANVSTRMVYIMDPLCSWCWGFSPVFEALSALAAQRGMAIEWVAGGLRHEQRPMDDAGRARTLGYWQQVNQYTGQQFDLANGLPDRFVYNTEPVCRALVVARELDASRVADLVQRIQRAFYADRRDVTRADVLLELVEQAGLDRKKFALAFDTDIAHKKTAADKQWAENLGISGFPTVLVQHNGLWALLTNGYQPLDALQPLLERWMEQNLNG